MSRKPAFQRAVRAALPPLFATLGGVWSAPAGAQSAAAAPPALRVESSTCSHALVDEVERITGIELKNSALLEGANAPRVVLSCSERVSLIRALVAGHESVRQLDLARTDEALQPRVIALAIAELVRDTARGEAVEPKPAVAPPVVEPAPAPAPNERPPSEPANHLVAFAKLDNFGSNLHLLAGGGLGFSHDIGRFSLGLGPSLTTGQRSLALGSVRTLAADLSVRLALRFPSRSLPGEIGIGHAVGVARISGTSSGPDASAGSVIGAWAGPFLFGTLDVALSEPVFLQVAAQLGVVTFPVRGYVSRAPDVDVAGVWSGLSLGLGVDL